MSDVSEFHKHAYVEGDQKVSVHLTNTVQSSGAHRLFDHPVYITQHSNFPGHKNTMIIFVVVKMPKLFENILRSLYQINIK
jgi:hypothetical protein